MKKASPFDGDFRRRVSADAQRLYDLLHRISWKTEKHLAEELGIRVSKIKLLKEELEDARMIDIHFHRNGKRSNPRHEILKRSKNGGSSIFKHFSNPLCAGDWAALDRNSLIECYCKSGWSIIPFESKGKRPVRNFSPEMWRAMTQNQKIDFFFENPNLNVGFAICHATVVDLDEKVNVWTQHQDFLDTLTVSTANGFHYYFRQDAVVKTSVKVLPGIDIRAKGSYVVLPPSLHPTGAKYEWFNLARPKPLPIDFRREWRSQYFDLTQRSGGNFKLPNIINEGTRNDVIWRYGRHLKNLGRSFYEIEIELNSVNSERCRPPFSSREMQQLIENVWARPNRPGFHTKRDS